MNCRRARRSIPLLAGNDLPERKARQLRVHLERCEMCRKTLREYSAALRRVKELADRETAADWTEAEWQALTARTTSARIEKRPFIFSLFEPRLMTFLARGLAMVVAAVIIGLIFWNTVLKPRPNPVVPTPAYVRKPETAPPVLPPNLQNKNDRKEPAVLSQERPIIVVQAREHERPETRPKEPAGAKKNNIQDVVSVTLVSQDTGLKVVWFLNRNFQWVGEEK